MSVKRHLILNGAATLFQQAVVAGRQLVTVPFFLYAWGAETYGEWLTLSAIPMAMALCDLGLGTAAANSFVLNYNRGEVVGAARAMKTGLLLIAVSTALGVLIALGVLYALLLSNSLSRLSVAQETAVGVVAILLFSRLASLAKPLNAAWFRAARRAHTATQLATYFEVVRTLGTITLLWSGAGMLSIAVCDCIVSIASVGWLHARGKRLLPDVHMQGTSLMRSEIAEYFLKGLAFTMSPIRLAINNQGTLLVTRLALGPESVALVSTLRTVVNSLSQLYGGINATIFPELQRAIATGEMSVARRVYRIGITAATTSSLIGCTALFFAGPTIYNLWTSAQLSPPRYAWCILIAAILTHSLWRTAGSAFAAANRPESFAIAGIIAASIGVAVSAILAMPIGINGILSGLLMMEVVMAFYVIPASCAIVGQSVAKLPNQILEERRTIARSLLRARTA